MVGHSGAGKTSFMAGLYRYLGESTDGYGISAKKENQKRQLSRMADALSKGRYPAGTDVQSQYEFSFTVHGEDLVPFNWIDYRGGILLSDSPDESDMDKFMNSIQKADALVVFLDGEKLSQPGSCWNMEYDILISCIENSLSVSHNSWFPISFVITKCDLVSDGTSFYGLHRFENLFSQISQSKTVGSMLIQCSITSDVYFSPFLVLAYSVYGGSPIYINRTINAINSAQRRAEAHRPSSILGTILGVGEQILSGVAEIFDAGWQTEYEKTWAADADVEKLQAKLNELQSRADELKGKLEKWQEDNLIQCM